MLDFSAMSWIFFLFFGAVLFLIVVGSMVHFLMFGTVFGLIVKRIADQTKLQEQLQAANNPKPCSYCGVTIPAAVDECPGCGAKR